jgi:hypothetical protein
MIYVLIKFLHVLGSLGIAATYSVEADRSRRRPWAATPCRLYRPCRSRPSTGVD